MEFSDGNYHLCQIKIKVTLFFVKMANRQSGICFSFCYLNFGVTIFLQKCTITYFYILQSREKTC